MSCHLFTSKIDVVVKKGLRTTCLEHGETGNYLQFYFTIVYLVLNFSLNEIELVPNRLSSRW